MTNKPIKFETDDQYKLLQEALAECFAPELINSTKSTKEDKKPA